MYEETKNFHWVILEIALSLTLSVWIGFLNSESELQHIKFNANVESMTHSISDRLTQYEQVVIGAKGLFGASLKVEMDEWKNYIEIQNIDSRFPGI